MRTSIQEARTVDIGCLNDLMSKSKAHWGYDQAFMDIFMSNFAISDEYISDNAVRMFFIEGEIAGFFSFSYPKQFKSELDHLFLHPDYIGKGIGRILWDICCDEAKTLGVNEFIIWTDPHAEPFYLKMGCEKIGTRKSPCMPNRYPSIYKYSL